MQFSAMNSFVVDLQEGAKQRSEEPWFKLARGPLARAWGEALAAISDLLYGETNPSLPDRGLLDE